MDSTSRWIGRAVIYRVCGKPSNNTVSSLLVILSSKKRRGKVQLPNVMGWRQKSWELGAEDAKKLKTYYTKYEAYVKPKSNKVFEKYKFHQNVQQEGGSLEQFLTDLKLLVKGLWLC